MSDDANMQAARRATDAFNAGDLDTIAKYADPDLVWRPAIGVLDDREYHGLEGMAEYLRDLDASFEGVRFVTESVRAPAPDTVLLTGRLHATGARSGAQVSDERGLVMRFREGKIAHMESFSSAAEGLAAAQEGAAHG